MCTLLSVRLSHLLGCSLGEEANMGTEAPENLGEVENVNGNNIVKAEYEKALRTVIRKVVSQANYNRDTYLDILKQFVKEFDAVFSPEKAYLKDLAKEELMNLGYGPKEPYLKKLVKDELMNRWEEQQAESISKRMRLEKQWEERRNKEGWESRITWCVSVSEGKSTIKTVPNMWAYNLNRKLAALQAL